MLKISIYFIALTTLWCAHCLADTPKLWQHEVSISYGHAKEIFYPVQNTGVIASAIFHRFKIIAKTLSFSINGDAAYWMADTKDFNRMPAISLDLAARGYFDNPLTSTIRPYLTTSFGPAYVFERKFGDNELGSNIALQITMGAGIEFGQPDHAFDVNWQLYHYCDAGFASPNRGTNVLFVLSAGYAF